MLARVVLIEILLEVEGIAIVILIVHIIKVGQRHKFIQMEQAANVIETLV
jgi:hypothetical protein